MTNETYGTGAAPPLIEPDQLLTDPDMVARVLAQRPGGVSGAWAASASIGLEPRAEARRRRGLLGWVSGVGFNRRGAARKAAKTPRICTSPGGFIARTWNRQTHARSVGLDRLVSLSRPPPPETTFASLRLCGFARDPHVECSHESRHPLCASAPPREVTSASPPDQKTPGSSRNRVGLMPACRWNQRENAATELKPRCSATSPTRCRVSRSRSRATSRRRAAR